MKNTFLLCTFQYWISSSFQVPQYYFPPYPIFQYNPYQNFYDLIGINLHSFKYFICSEVKFLLYLGMRSLWDTRYGRQPPLSLQGRFPPVLPQYHPPYPFIPSPTSAARTSGNFHPVVHQSTSCECGRSSNEKQVNRVVNRMNRGDRVIGGEEATVHLFPWIVRLKGGCAGKILNKMLSFEVNLKVSLKEVGDRGVMGDIGDRRFGKTVWLGETGGGGQRRQEGQGKLLGGFQVIMVSVCIPGFLIWRFL